ncbi:dihydrodipicolinate synthase family protein [Paenibacillus caui]|uniref:dihydrodipicolinate synthase family protein n=1 Tax=Paenibacillus caui TaxID=2873927 RepID=UPI001CA88C13|nr:dihydrodipicolinate synthase family protein [Paenibacillus caui]
MNKPFPGGVWPVMLTPYTRDNQIDYNALEQLMEWYIGRGVKGLFAVCQSSEMFFLSEEERLKLVGFVKEKAAGRVPVIASGHIAETLEEQAEEIRKMADTGVDAVILITNRLAAEHETDEVWRNNLHKLLEQIPDDIPLGFYECPYPYKRLISPDLLKSFAGTGRFYFLKDTSCDVAHIQAKLEAVQGTNLKIYNANSATLLETLKIGVEGYSGVMANFHPELYVWLLQHWKNAPDEADELMNALSIMSLIERQVYPLNAKHFLKIEGVPIFPSIRTNNVNEFTATNLLEIRQLYGFSASLAQKYLGRDAGTRI